MGSDKEIQDLFWELNELYNEREWLGDRLESMGGYAYGRLGSGMQDEKTALHKKIETIKAELVDLGVPRTTIPQHPGFYDEMY